MDVCNFHGSPGTIRMPLKERSGGEPEKQYAGAGYMRRCKLGWMATTIIPERRSPLEPSRPVAGGSPFRQECRMPIAGSREQEVQRNGHEDSLDELLAVVVGIIFIIVWLKWTGYAFKLVDFKAMSNITNKTGDY